MKISNDFLSILVPKFIKERMEQGMRFMAEDQGEVTILFAYICQFDKILTKVGKSIVATLDNIFRTFDLYCANHGIQKIETVGYTYLVCAGVADVEKDLPAELRAVNPTRRMVSMAFEMMGLMSTLTVEGIPLKMKVGVHRGRVIAGVIGFHKPQFSLVGDPVNTTSRIASTTEEGKISISKSVFEDLQTCDIENEFRFVQRDVFVPHPPISQPP
jgi:phospholipid-translocating ATPase